MGSPTLVFVVLISENDRCIPAELKSHLSYKFCNAETIYWKKLSINVCIYHTLNIKGLSNRRRQFIATFDDVW